MSKSKQIISKQSIEEASRLMNPDHHNQLVVNDEFNNLIAPKQSESYNPKTGITTKAPVFSDFKE
tara:strand:- start:1335 stop:1529 length:195 start_codon:yes stop_codon:yes gene_type:complete